MNLPNITTNGEARIGDALRQNTTTMEKLSLNMRSSEEALSSFYNSLSDKNTEAGFVAEEIRNFITETKRASSSERAEKYKTSGYFGDIITQRVENKEQRDQLLGIFKNVQGSLKQSISTLDSIENSFIKNIGNFTGIMTALIPETPPIISFLMTRLGDMVSKNLENRKVQAERKDRLEIELIKRMEESKKSSFENSKEVEKTTEKITKISEDQNPKFIDLLSQISQNILALSAVMKVTPKLLPEKEKETIKEISEDIQDLKETSQKMVENTSETIVEKTRRQRMGEGKNSETAFTSKGFFSSMLSGMTQVFVGVFGALGGLVKSVLILPIVLAATYFVGKLMQKFEWMKDAISYVWDKTVDWISGLFDVFKGLFKVLSGDFSEGLSLIGDGFLKMLKVPLEVLRDMLNGLEKLIIKAVDGVAAISKMVWKSFVNWITELKDSVVSWVSGIWETVKVKFAEGMEWISKMWDTAVNGILSIPDKLSGWAESIGQSMMSGMSSLGDSILSFWSGIGTKLSGVWDSIKTGIQDSLGKVADSMYDSIVAPIKKLFSDMIFSIVDSIPDFMLSKEMVKAHNEEKKRREDLAKEEKEIKEKPKGQEVRGMIIKPTIPTIVTPESSLSPQNQGQKIQASEPEKLSMSSNSYGENAQRINEVAQKENARMVAATSSAGNNIRANTNQNVTSISPVNVNNNSTVQTTVSVADPMSFLSSGIYRT